MKLKEALELSDYVRKDEWIYITGLVFEDKIELIPAISINGSSIGYVYGGDSGDYSSPDDEGYIPVGLSFDRIIENEALFDCNIPEYGDVFTVEEFKNACACRAFVDYDGHGHPAKDGRMDRFIFVKPSRLFRIPKDSTHIVWFNK